ncbi:hypothetical protein QA641_06035 [Bradyrhizobium sp. CB1650]|uniref:hypothetical protein n=1 Tax=Bradyrhizobium sp. CB1650 TaxID=3039153 RepID=UPI002435634E|nr:hypothetical protein [Bradyrhizobium sp. CB1650]WGD53474.1 hypothetical protein QA641_06035 [Bradyrhizobium sp. CB1650]
MARRDWRATKVMRINRNRSITRGLSEEEHYLCGLMEIGEAVLCIVALAIPYDPKRPGDAKERDDRRFALRVTNELMKRLPCDSHGADLLVEEGLPLWKYDPLTATLADEDDPSD